MKPASRKSLLVWEDALLNHCRTIQTLAGLLEKSGRDDGLKIELVNETGGLIGDEVARLKKLLTTRPGRKEAR